jgi:hypothetical protein
MPLTDRLLRQKLSRTFEVTSTRLREPRAARTTPSAKDANRSHTFRRQTGSRGETACSRRVGCPCGTSSCGRSRQNAFDEGPFPAKCVWWGEFRTFRASCGTPNAFLRDTSPPNEFSRETRPTKRVFSGNPPHQTRFLGKPAPSNAVTREAPNGIRGT